MMTTQSSKQREDRDDPEYWDALAQRVVNAAGLPERRGAIEWLGHSRGSWFGAAVVVVVAVIWAALPADSSIAEGADIEAALAPQGAVALIVAQDGPPPIAALILRPASSDK
jgi:hypothetical protein